MHFEGYDVIRNVIIRNEIINPLSQIQRKLGCSKPFHSVISRVILG